MKNDKIAASILGVEDKPKIVRKIISKGITHIHYDVMDGEFVPAISLPTSEIISIVNECPKHFVDVHLMVKNPIVRIRELVKFTDAFSFHYDACSEEEIANIISEFKGITKLGIVINLDVELNKVLELLKHFDFVLVMSVQAGKGGQKFDEKALEKVRIIRKNYPNIFIQVDGGINVENIGLVFKSGAQNTVIGSFLIKNIDNDQVIKLLKKPSQNV